MGNTLVSLLEDGCFLVWTLSEVTHLSALKTTSGADTNYTNDKAQLLHV